MSVAGVTPLGATDTSVERFAADIVFSTTSRGQVLFSTEHYTHSPTRYLIFGIFLDVFGLPTSSTFTAHSSLSAWLYLKPLPFFDSES